MAGDHRIPICRPSSPDSGFRCRSRPGSAPVVRSRRPDSAGSLNTGRYIHTPTLLNTGKVLIAAGFNGDITGGVLASAELYDPRAGSFSNTGSLITPTGYPTATPLYNGMVLIAGGEAGPGAELYDPAVGSFSAAGSLNTARDNHTATLLTDGTVLLAGGLSLDGSTVLSSAEIYTPTTIGLATTVSVPPTNGATITNVVLSGAGSVSPASNVLLEFVSGNAPTIPVGVSFNYSVVDTVCPGCIEQIEVGSNSDPGPQVCAYNGGAVGSGSASIAINVPNIPGRYYIGTVPDLNDLPNICT